MRGIIGPMQLFTKQELVNQPALYYSAYLTDLPESLVSESIDRFRDGNGRVRSKGGEAGEI
jgi:hypothetical protein